MIVVGAAPQSIRVFVASPGDTATERSALSDVVKDVNLAITALAPGRAVLELVAWETAVHPELGRPQGVINTQVGAYDVLVGMMWRRFGTPTGVAGSGTEEEFRAAYSRWAETGRPVVMFYFSLGEGPTPWSTGEIEQLRQVISFREELSGKGLVKTYADAADFPTVVRRDLLLLVGRLLGDPAGPAEAAEQLASAGPAGPQSELDPRIANLAAEYERIRKTMGSGSARTRQMEIVASRMRSLAVECYGFVGPLAASASPGKRLAAIAFLQTIPHPGHLGWLTDRFRPGPDEERPFVQYNAGVALLTAARVLAGSHRREIREAVASALPMAEAHGRLTDRYLVLDEAARELDAHRQASRDDERESD